MKKLVKESICVNPGLMNKQNESLKQSDVIVDHYFYEIINYLRKRIYPKLNDDDLHKLNGKLRDWFIENMGKNFYDF